MSELKANTYIYEIAAEDLAVIFDCCAVEIRHIGSTVIPHVNKSRIVDIAVGVTGFNSVFKLIPELESRGYAHVQESGNNQRILFEKYGETVCHIHVIIFDSPYWHECIGFRNYLCIDKRAACRYEAYDGDKEEFFRQSARKAQVYYFLGRTVNVTIDRPVGSPHPARDFTYPINYGCIDGVIAPDGEELDVYVLGDDTPRETMTAKVIGIIHREDDVEDKLVAAVGATKYYQTDIEELTDFQECYYKTKVTGLYQKSCGAVVCRRSSEMIEFLILHQKMSRTWSFPKGHAEAYETEEETAVREIKEETNITAELISGFRETVSYTISGLVEKEVVLFLALTDSNVTPQFEEVEDFLWADRETALKLLSHSAYAEILPRAENML